MRCVMKCLIQFIVISFISGIYFYWDVTFPTLHNQKAEVGEDNSLSINISNVRQVLSFFCPNDSHSIGTHRNITSQMIATPGDFLPEYLVQRNICSKYPDKCIRLFRPPLQKEIKPIKFVEISYPYNMNVSTPLRLYFKNTGALGNAMFQYASAIMVARYLGRELVIRKIHAKYFMGVFEMNSGHVREQKYFPEPIPTNFVFEHTSLRFTKRYYTLDSDYDLNIRYCFQSYKHFQHAADEIRLLYQFNKTVLSQAKQNLDQTLEVAPFEVCTTVGIHVRRGDQIKFSILAPKQYYESAMEYFRRHYKNVFFVVSSLERKWCVSNLSGNDWALGPEKQTAGVDMAMLTLCDHIITSEGTYSFWVGWLSKGEVLYHNISYAWENSLPHWVPIGPYLE